MSFLSPSVPKPKPPPPVPQIDDTAMMRNEQDRIQQRRAAGTTILTSSNGLPNLGSTVTASAGGQ